jgi:hypothetical protein
MKVDSLHVQRKRVSENPKGTGVGSVDLSGEIIHGFAGDGEILVNLPKVIGFDPFETGPLVIDTIPIAGESPEQDLERLEVGPSDR